MTTTQRKGGYGLLVIAMLVGAGLMIWAPLSLNQPKPQVGDAIVGFALGALVFVASLVAIMLKVRKSD